MSIADIVLVLIIVVVSVLRIIDGITTMRDKSYTVTRRKRNGSLIPETEDIKIHGDYTKVVGLVSIISGISTFPFLIVPVIYPIIGFGEIFLLWFIITGIATIVASKAGADRYFDSQNM